MKYYHSLRTSEEYFNDHYGKETFNPITYNVIIKRELKERPTVIEEPKKKAEVKEVEKPKPKPKPKKKPIKKPVKVSVQQPSLF